MAHKTSSSYRSLSDSSPVVGVSQVMLFTSWSRAIKVTWLAIRLYFLFLHEAGDFLTEDTVTMKGQYTIGMLLHIGQVNSSWTQGFEGPMTWAYDLSDEFWDRLIKRSN
jgi:hypothetical protein